jgi:hypothetical protein
VRQESPADQYHGKRNRNNVVLQHARVEQNDTDEQDRKPLLEGKSGVEELPGKIEQQNWWSIFKMQ